MIPNRLDNMDIFWFVQSVIGGTFNRFVTMTPLNRNTGQFNIDVTVGVEFTLEFIYANIADQWYVRVFDSKNGQLISDTYVNEDDLRDKKEYVDLIKNILSHIHEKISNRAIEKELSQ